MHNKHSRAATLFAALFFGGGSLLSSGAFAAAQFTVTPLSLALPAGKRATSLTLGNGGGEPVTVQTELLSWSQDSGDDVYAPTKDLLASPPIFSLPPQGSQVIRVGRLKMGAAPASEVAYRLKVAEVPPSGSKEGAITTVMQLTFPLFVPPADRKASAKLEGTLELKDKRSLVVAVSNKGAVHGKITALRALQDGATLAEKQTNIYVLAGAKRIVNWPDALAKAKAGAVEIQLQLEGRDRKIVLPLTVSP